MLQGLCIARGAILIKSRSRLLRLPAFWPELSSRRQTAGYGALLVAIQLTGGQFAAVARFHAAARTVVHVAAALNALLTLHFLRLCWRRGSAPEPFWFPATVSVATLAVVGPKVGRM